MPCYDSRDPKQYHGVQIERLNHEIQNLQKRNDKLARLLCELCNEVDGLPGVFFKGELAKWWEEHQELDRERGFRI